MREDKRASDPESQRDKGPKIHIAKDPKGTQKRTRFLETKRDIQSEKKQNRDSDSHKDRIAKKTE